MERDIYKDSLISIKRLYANEDYYSLVFKRTERVVSAVFYILSFLEKNEKTNIHYVSLSERAMAVHDAVIKSLNLAEHEGSESHTPLLTTLLGLDSSLRLAVAARVVSPEVELTLTTEIESLLRYLRANYVEAGMPGRGITTTTKESGKTQKRETVQRRRRPAIPAGDLSSDAVLVYTELSDRVARIKTVLEAKPEATIKDLSEIITDVSPKTLQRDLNSLIEKGEVKRQGERRWSKYSLS